MTQRWSLVTLLLCSLATAAGAQPAPTTQPPAPSPPVTTPAPYPPPMQPGAMPAPYPPPMQPGAMPAPYPPPTQPGAMPAPYPPPMQPGAMPAPYPAPAPAFVEQAPNEPKAGDFDAGGQARFPNGPDEMGTYKTWNWVAADVKGRYYLLPTVTANVNMPLAIIHPDMIARPVAGGGTAMVAPKMFGGVSARLEAKLPKSPFIKSENELGLALAVSYMHDGAALLSEKDYPLFTGEFHPGFNGALITKVKLSNLLSFSLLPAWVWQKAGEGSLTAFQMPTALIVKLGDVVKLSIDLSIYTGDDYSFRPSKGGRLGSGAALDLKIGPILAHAGTGFATLLTSELGAYPTIGDSVYFDVNVKYAK